jgi:hypothetical protein
VPISGRVATVSTTPAARQLQAVCSNTIGKLFAPFVDALYADGITALQGAFSREWVEQLRNFHDSLPPLVREHLLCRVVDTLVPVAVGAACADSGSVLERNREAEASNSGRSRRPSGLAMTLPCPS